MNGELYHPIPFASFWAWALFLAPLSVLLTITGFVIVNGRCRLSEGYAGVKVRRWSLLDIVIHWLAACSCLLLMLTGGVIASGRFLIPVVIGETLWRELVKVSIQLHEMMIPLFIFSWLLLAVNWIPKQLPHRSDFPWFKSGGGYLNFGKLKGCHPDAGFANGGEKAWFWTFALAGVLLISSGLLLLKPSLSLPVDLAYMALTVHLVSTMVISAFAVVHVAMAVVISEGALTNMITGYCDENWAKQHHSLWLKDLKKS